MKTASLFITALLILSSCINTNWDKELLYGQWEVKEWINTVDNSKIDQKMDFEFSKDGKYSVNYGPMNESGVYWIMGDFLHTIEKDQAEKKVKLTGLTADALSFEMNRGGRIETVVFKRKD